MQNQFIRNHHFISTTVFLISCLGLITITALDKFYWRTGILTEGLPDFSQNYLVRSIVICVSTIAIFWAFMGTRKPKMAFGNDYKIPLELLGIFGTLFTSIVFLFLFIFETRLFNAFSKEDNIIEWGSAILLFVGCFIFFISFLKFRTNSRIPKFTLPSLALLSLALFVVAMEEVSWFQRVLRVDTPDMFNGNAQQEINLHNFATDYIENIYYLGTFLFLVILPFVSLLFPALSNNNYLRLFIARPVIIVIGTVFCAYNFDMWNISFTQITFFSSIAILFGFMVFNPNRNERYVSLFAIILLVATQWVFLSYGDRFTRLSAVTEYKEFFISLVFFIYSLDVYNYLGRVYSIEHKPSLFVRKKFTIAFTRTK